MKYSYYFSEEEKETLVSKMSENDQKRYKNALTNFERTNFIEKIGTRRFNKLSTLEKSVYGMTKEEMLFLEKARQSGESILEMSCGIFPKEESSIELKQSGKSILEKTKELIFGKSKRENSNK